jgi:hypothetical protein
MTSTLTLSYSGDTYVVDVALSTQPVTVEVAMARDAYQLALADGFVGTRAEWRASLQGDPGPPGDPGPIGPAGLIPITLTLAEYLDLSVEQQLDPNKWYVIPSISP